MKNHRNDLQRSWTTMQHITTKTVPFHSVWGTSIHLNVLEKDATYFGIRLGCAGASQGMMPDGSVCYFEEPVNVFLVMSVDSPAVRAVIWPGSILYAVNFCSVISYPNLNDILVIMQKMPKPLILSFFRPGVNDTFSSTVRYLPLDPSVSYEPEEKLFYAIDPNRPLRILEVATLQGRSEIDQIKRRWMDQETGVWHDKFQKCVPDEWVQPYRPAVATSGASPAVRVAPTRRSGKRSRQETDVDGELVAAENELDDTNFGEETSMTVFSTYRPQKLRVEAYAHPAAVVESSALHAVEPPDITYEIKVPMSCITSALLSSLQLESIAYAGQSHGRKLLNGSRAGFFIGDGAGVGKGRQIAGILIDNMQQGRAKALWVSVSSDLFVDARRDFDDLGAKDVPVVALSKLPYGLISKMRFDRSNSSLRCGVNGGGGGRKNSGSESGDNSSSGGKKNGRSGDSESRSFAGEKVVRGCLFLTYSCLIAAGGKKSNRQRRKGKTRMNQILRWLAKNKEEREKFDGVIVFDECHRAKNLSFGKTRGGLVGSKTAMAVLNIQRALPNARVVYCSATGVTNPGDLGYMTRLGLWDDAITKTGEAGKSGFVSFASRMQRSGIGAMEMLAMDMRKMGMYIARTLSFQRCTFDIVKVKSNQTFDRVYDEAVKFWMVLRKRIEEATLQLVASHAIARQFSYLDLIDPRSADVIEFDGMRSSSVFVEDNTSGSDSDDGGGASSAWKRKLVKWSKKQMKKYTGSMMWRMYWAAHQRFFRYLCVSAKVPEAIKIAKQALKDGKCAVIGLQSTGEARTIAALEESDEGSLDNFVSAPKAVLKDYVLKCFPVGWVPFSDIDCERKKELDAAIKVRQGTRPQRLRTRAVNYSEILGDGTSDDNNNDDDDDDDDVYDLTSSSSPLSSRSTTPTPTNKDPKRKSDTKDAALAKARELHARTVAMRDELLAKIEQFDLPTNPIDELIDKLGGPDNVAEMTGRKGRMIRLAGDNKPSFVSRSEIGINQKVSLDTINLHEKELFNGGAKYVAVISEAASAGISLHADRRVANQRRRVHVTLELPWSASKAVQQLGRTHRSNQSSGPEFKLLISSIGGEKRFASCVAQRIQSMGALTHGNRHAGQLRLDDYNYLTPVGSRALVQLCMWAQGGRSEFVAHLNETKRSSAMRQFVDMGFAKTSTSRISDTKARDVAVFFNRILGIPIAAQTDMVDMYESILRKMIADDKLKGVHNDGIKVLSGKRLFLMDKKEKEGEEKGGDKLKDVGETVYVHPLSSASTRYVRIGVERGLSFDEALTIRNKARDRKVRFGFYRSKKRWFGKDHFALFVEKKSSEDEEKKEEDLECEFNVWRPGTGATSRVFTSALVAKKWIKITSEEEMRKAWQGEWERTGRVCIHGSKCKRGPSCDAGKRVQCVHLLCGVITPIVSITESLLGHAKCLRVVQADIDSSETNETKSSESGNDTDASNSPSTLRVIGVRVPSKHALAIVERLKSHSEKVNSAKSAAAAAAAAAAQGNTSDDSNKKTNCGGGEIKTKETDDGHSSTTTEKRSSRACENDSALTKTKTSDAKREVVIVSDTSDSDGDDDIMIVSSSTSPMTRNGAVDGNTRKRRISESIIDRGVSDDDAGVSRDGKHFVLTDSSVVTLHASQKILQSQKLTTLFVRIGAKWRKCAVYANKTRRRGKVKTSRAVALCLDSESLCRSGFLLDSKRRLYNDETNGELSTLSLEEAAKMCLSLVEKATKSCFGASFGDILNTIDDAAALAGDAQKQLLESARAVLSNACRGKAKMNLDRCLQLFSRPPSGALPPSDENLPTFGHDDLEDSEHFYEIKEGRYVLEEDGSWKRCTLYGLKRERSLSASARKVVVLYFDGDDEWEGGHCDYYMNGNGLLFDADDDTIVTKLHANVESLFLCAKLFEKVLTAGCARSSMFFDHLRRARKICKDDAVRICVERALDADDDAASMAPLLSFVSRFFEQMCRDDTIAVDTRCLVTPEERRASGEEEDQEEEEEEVKVVHKMETSETSTLNVDPPCDRTAPSGGDDNDDDDAAAVEASENDVPIADWDVRRVLSWLNSVGLESLRPIFERASICGKRLRSLQDRDLIEMGVGNFMHRRKVLLKAGRLS
eukprot:g1309.t1